MYLITENDIKFVLSQREKLVCKIHNEEKELLLRIESETRRMDELQRELITAKSLRGKVLTECAISPSSHEGDYMLSMLEDSEKLRRQYMKGMHEQFVALVQQEEMVQRIIFCYETLAGETKEILEAFFIRKEKWEYIESRFKVSHRTLVDKRRHAIEALMDLYHRDITIEELGKMKNGMEEGRKISRRRGKNSNGNKNLEGQMNLFDYGNIH